jgi:hypothetical protein
VGGAQRRDLRASGSTGRCSGNPLPKPDHRNWSWREYGNRVGIWRSLEIADQFEIPLGTRSTRTFTTPIPRSWRR